MSFNFGSIIEGAVGGAATGSAVPGVGTITGGVIGGVGNLVSGLFGGGGVPNHEDPDEIKIAKANGITQQQASNICGYEESHSPRNYDDICKQAAGDQGYFQQLWANYNRDHPSSPILLQQPSQVVNTQATQGQVNDAQASQGATNNSGNTASGGTKATSNTTTYALIGGSALLAIIIAILLLKK